MEVKRTSVLQQLREAKGLSRKELSEQSGVNFRSLQDYEQGHKDISSAKGDTLYRLSLTLGCNIEDILIVKPGSGEERRRRLSAYYHLLTIELLKTVEGIGIYSENYKTSARLKLKEGNCSLVFCYKGDVIELPFNARITDTTVPWLRDIAVLMLDSYIKKRRFEERYSMEGDGTWNES